MAEMLMGVYRPPPAGPLGARVNAIITTIVEFTESEPYYEMRESRFCVDGPSPIGFGALMLPPGYGLILRVYVTAPEKDSPNG